MELNYFTFFSFSFHGGRILFNNCIKVNIFFLLVFICHSLFILFSTLLLTIFCTFHRYSFYFASATIFTSTVTITTIATVVINTTISILPPSLTIIIITSANKTTITSIISATIITINYTVVSLQEVVVYIVIVL